MPHDSENEKVRRQINSFLGIGNGDEDETARDEGRVPTESEAAANLRAAALFFLDRHRRFGAPADLADANMLLNHATLLDP